MTAGTSFGYVGPLQATGDASQVEVLASGAALPRTAAARAGDTINVKDFGPCGFGVADSAPAINTALNYLRTRLAAGLKAYRLEFPYDLYTVLSTLNFSGLTTFGGVIEGNGSRIVGAFKGGAVVDAVGSRYLNVRDLTIAGDTTTTPTIGVQIGRNDVTANVSCDTHAFTRVFTSGNFTFAGLYNLNAETSGFYGCDFSNGYTGGTCYGLVQDGPNHWQQPAIAGQLQPTNAPQSFNENVFVSCTFATPANGFPIWMGQTGRHRYVSCYVSTGGPNGCVLFSYSAADKNSALDIDCHFETTAITDVFLLTGPNTGPFLPSFRFRDHYPQASNSVFKTDTGIASVNAPDLDVSIPTFAASGMKLFAAPSLWTVTGKVYIGTASAWTAPASWQGQLMLGSTLSSTASNLYSSLGFGLASAGGKLSVSLANIQPGGPVVGVNVTSGGVFYSSSAGAYTPTVTISPSDGGGTNVTATVTAIKKNSAGNIGSGGAGYVVGDTLSYGDGVSATRFQITVTAVGTGGAITAFTDLTATGTAVTVPALPIALTGGTGSGATLTNTNWSIGAVGITNPGTLYTAATATFSTAHATTSFATGTVTVGSFFSTTVGTGLSAAGTTLATGTLLSAQDNFVTTVASGTGVVLPAVNVGTKVSVRNAGTNPLNVWPSSASDQIESLAAGAASTAAVGATAGFMRDAAAHWYRVQ